MGGEDKLSLQQKRDEFIVDIRREERMTLINQKKFYSQQDKAEISNTDDIELAYLKDNPHASTLIPHIQALLAETPDVAKVKQYVELVMEGDLFQKHTGIIMLRKCLSIQNNTPIQEVIDLNAVPTLISLIQDDSNPQLQIEATWCVTNMATGTTLQTNSLVEKGIIPIYVKLLSKNNIHLVEQAVWGIGNIAGDCLTFRNALNNAQAMPHFVELYHKLKNQSEKVKDQLIWAASNLCRLKPPPDISKVFRGIEIFALELKTATKFNVKNDCLCALSQICRSETVRMFANADIIGKVIENLYDAQIVIVHPALRIVGIFTNSEDELCQKVLDADGIPALEHLLSSTTKILRKEALWAISNITAGNEHQLGQVVGRPSMVDKLFTIITTDVDENKVEAIWAICNSTKNANISQLQYLLSRNLLDLFQEYLTKDKDSKILNVILEAIYVITEKIKQSKPELFEAFLDTLYAKGVVARIEELQTHSNNHVYKKSYKYITTFLDTED